MSEALFNKLYTKLNPKQREAVDAIEGPVMVIAGPGTGKTSILTLRIANILKRTDTPPDAVLALTFTESGAYSMRKKLVEIIGGAAYRVGMFTFHGFANHLIGRFAESFPRIIGGRPAHAADQARMLEGIFLKNQFALIRPFGDIFHFVPEGLRAIRDLKRENLSPTIFFRALTRERRELLRAPDRFHKSGRFKGELRRGIRERLRRIEKSFELAEVYRQYEERLATERLFDFEDMILEVIRALERDKDLLSSVREQYQYVLADEHQDANSAQNRILELLTSFDDTPNLFLVGDEKQAIYRFQGASLRNFLYFKKRYPKTRLITLEENYRSTQALLNAAHSLMEKGKVPKDVSLPLLRLRLRAARAGAPRAIRFFEFERHETEIAFLAEDVERQLKLTGASGIAILVRDNRDALPLVEAFEKTKIPFTAPGNDDPLEDEMVRKLFLILRAAAAPGSPERFAELLHVDFLGVEPAALYEFLLACRNRRAPLFAAVRNPKLLQNYAVPTRIRTLYDDLNRFARVAKNRSAAEAIETVARESGFLEALLAKRGSLRSLERLDALFADLKELSSGRREFSLAEFLEAVDRLKRHGLSFASGSARPEFRDAVSILTAHRAKGLEFDRVYITGTAFGHWGSRRPRTGFYVPQKGAASEDDEDERRLFFVALTRSRGDAVITMSKMGAAGKPLLPSQFVEDIDRRFITRENCRALESRLRKKTPFILRPKINAGPSLSLKEYLQRVFLEQGLTVTAFNNYLSCPWEYFFKNLVRLPQLPEPYLLYGEAMHDALRRFFDFLAGGKKPGEKALLTFFDKALERSPLPLREFSAYQKRGRKALSGYFKKRRSSLGASALNEFEVTGVFVPLSVGKARRVELLLRGILDRIERHEDGTVTVVDYKTGRPRTRAEILGETKSAAGRPAGDLKRQLDFYKVLLDNFEKGRYRMTEGVIDFIEPDARGEYRRETFAVTQSDAAAMVEEVQRIGSEIYHLAFWDKHCGWRGCEYCRLRDAMA